MPSGSDASVNFIFGGELAAYREFVAANGSPPVEFPAGAYLSRSAQVPARVYYLLEGMIKAYTSNANGFVRLLGYHRADTVCVLDGLRGTDPSVVTIQAITPVRAVPLTSGDLRRMGRLNPDFATDLAFFVGDTLRLMCFDAENQSIWNVAARLANFLCLYCQTPDYRLHRCVPMSQESLASAVNASRVQVARVCARLRREGVIRVSRCRLTILDRAALERLIP